jgi:uncharacterized repeat protein (TIGR03803 family)
MNLPRKCLALLLFIFAFLPVAFATGAGLPSVPCQGTIVSPTDDLATIINNGKKGQTFCIEGEHRITSTIQIRSGQSLIGTTNNARISGAVVLNPWHPTSTQGVYYYDGPYANTPPHQQDEYTIHGGNVCYWVTTYLDDLFFRTGVNNDQRIMRVLSETEVDPTQPVTTRGQAVTAGEAGRFFFDYSNHRIYVSLPNNLDPNAATVDLAIRLNNPNGDVLLFGAGQTNVTIQNLYIEKSMNYGLYPGIGWTLKDVTVRFIHNVGIYGMMGYEKQPAIIDNSLLTNNGRLALDANFTKNLIITNSEMSWNNIANFRHTLGQTGDGVCRDYKDAGAFHIYNDIGTPTQPAVTINNLRSHHNIGDGLWSDDGSQYNQITNSTLIDNERFGFYDEISCQVLFSGNTIYGNGYPIKNTDVVGGTGGVDVNDSNYGTFSSNLIYGNDGGYAFHLTLQTEHADMLSNRCLGAGGDGDTSNSLKHNQITGNTVYSCSALSSIGKVWGAGGSLNSRENQYLSNHYYLSDSTSNWFVDGDGKGGRDIPEDWGTWQQSNHDVQGSLAVGCARRTYDPEQIAYNFSGDGSPGRPYAGLIADKSGDLYGTTLLGGSNNHGAVFELTPTSSGWNESILYSFAGGTDGSHPAGNLTFDAAGHLYGTTTAGGGGNCPEGCGTVFELTPASGGWTESVIYSFTGGSDGRQPYSGLILSKQGTLYGTASLGGTVSANCPAGCGTVFALTPDGGVWSESVLYSFAGGNDGSAPYAGLTADKSGNLYGTTTAGGPMGDGTVFELASASGQWKETLLHTFSGNDGAVPYGGLVFDSANNLYGTAFQGGSGNYGVIFELVPETGGAWKETVLHTFWNNPAANPAAGLVIDSTGTLLGTAMQGGNSNSCAGECGVVFALSPTANHTWKYGVLHVFGGGTDGYASTAPVLVTGTGTLVGTTQAGGIQGGGMVFEVNY